MAERPGVTKATEEQIKNSLGAMDRQYGIEGWSSERKARLDRRYKKYEAWLSELKQPKRR